MTNTLEERIKNKLGEIEILMRSADSTFINIKYSKPQDHFDSLYHQNKALYLQNEIIIDYLQEIYETQIGEQK